MHSIEISQKFIQYIAFLKPKLKLTTFLIEIIQIEILQIQSEFEAWMMLCSRFIKANKVQ